VGLRGRLPLTSTTQPGPATLARPLQPAQTAQLARRPAPDQPRSQRPWVGHLGGVAGAPGRALGDAPGAPSRASGVPRRRSHERADDDDSLSPPCSRSS
jgi:hypothetical protein